VVLIVLLRSSSSKQYEVYEITVTPLKVVTTRLYIGQAELCLSLMWNKQTDDITASKLSTALRRKRI